MSQIITGSDAAVVGLTVDATPQLLFGMPQTEAFYIPDSVGIATIQILAKSATAYVVASWRIEVSWRWDSTATTLTLIGATVTTGAKDAAASSWNVTVAPASHAIGITVTGVAATVIEWLAIIDSQSIFRPYVAIGATLAEALDSSETGIDISDSTLFAIDDEFVVDSEHFGITSYAYPDTLTVVRGHNGTTAAAHSNGAAIYLRARTSNTLFMGSLLAEALDDSELGIDVDDGTRFAADDVILIDTEELFVDSVSVNTLTVMRAWNGTTAATHADNSIIYRAG